ncbi:hypothetical protein EsH8_V_000282 [Colletotrichum jinshuiense]
MLLLHFITPIFAAAAVAAVAPSDTSSSNYVGPLSLDALKEKRDVVKVLETREENCISVHLCLEEDWKGDCYWACFRPGEEAWPNSSWGHKVKSARPGQGAKCVFFLGPECSYRHEKQDMTYPGGNFKDLGKLEVGCFYCMKN